MSNFPKSSLFFLLLTAPLMLGNPTTRAAERMSPNPQMLAQTDLEREAEADRLFHLGIEQYQADRFPEAIQSWEAALQIYREIGVREAFPKESRRQEANSLRHLGIAYRSLGEYERAIDFYQKSLAIFQDIGNRTGEAKSLTNLGAAYRSLGQYEKAIEFFEQSLAISREIGDRSREAIILHALGNTYYSLGEYAKAIEFFEQSLAISREIDNSPDERLRQHHENVSCLICALNNLGNTYRRLGQYEKAIEFLEQSLTITRESGDRHREASALNSLGIAYAKLGQNERAIEFFEQSLAIHREFSNRDGEIYSFNNLGLIHYNLGQYERALDFIGESLVIAREISDCDGEAISLENLGVIYYKLEQYEKALDFLHQSLAIEQDIKRNANLLNTLGLTYYDLGQYERATKALFASIEIYESLRDEDLSDTTKIAFFDTQTWSYENLQRSLVAQGKIEQALEISERGRARAFVSLIAQKQGLHIADEPLSPPSIDRIRQLARQENITLVQYSVVGCDRLFAWVIQPTGTIDFREIDLSSVDDSFSQFITRSRETAGIRGCDLAIIAVTPTQEALDRQTSRQNQSLQQLHKLLIEPIGDLLPSDPEAPIVFIPHDSLFLVPFPALVNADGEYLIQNHTILTAPSIQVLELTQRANDGIEAFHVVQRKGPSPLQDILIVGNPTMPSVWNPDTNEMQRLSNLPGAESEAVAIAELLNTQPLLGDEATEIAVTQQMPTAQIIHLATHGLLDYGSPEETGVRDFPGAIALATGNGEDGLLTSAELLEMELQAELVVLSACDTGRGKLSSDGVVGLSRALISAGVPSIMVSLWAVPDAPTADLMVEFYQQWQATGNKAQALRQAMLVTMETHPKPRDWAAFTLIGLE